MLPIIIIVASLSALIGGFLGLYFRDRLHLVLGFTAGVLISVVVLDLIPEIFELTEELGMNFLVPMASLLGGFLIFHILEHLLLIHYACDEEGTHERHRHPIVGRFSALALGSHTFLDGMAIGFAFQVSPEIGLVVGLAIIAHTFSDGLNTVSLMLVHGNIRRNTILFLVLNALAPILGAVASFFFVLSQPVLVAVLGFVAGFLLYIGASDILPEAHSKGPSRSAIFTTILGMFFVFLLVLFGGE